MSNTYDGGNVRAISDNTISYNPDLSAGGTPANLGTPIDFTFVVPPYLIPPEEPSAYAAGGRYLEGDPVLRMPTVWTANEDIPNAPATFAPEQWTDSGKDLYTWVADNTEVIAEGETLVFTAPKGSTFPIEYPFELGNALGLKQVRPNASGNEFFQHWECNGAIVSVGTLVLAQEPLTFTAVYDRSPLSYTILIEAPQGIYANNGYIVCNTMDESEAYPDSTYEWGGAGYERPFIHGSFVLNVRILDAEGELYTGGASYTWDRSGIQISGEIEAGEGQLLISQSSALVSWLHPLHLTIYADDGVACRVFTIVSGSDDAVTHNE
jgi:hypothetical protein